MLEFIKDNEEKNTSIDKNNFVEKDGLSYMIVRTYSAGVYAGYVKEYSNKHAVLVNARRIWSWQGAAELGELATRGTSDPENCKFPNYVPLVYLTEVIEMIPITEKAKKTIDAVKVWTE